MMDPDGTNQVEVTTGPDIDTQPTWAPSGTALAFRRSFVDGSSDIVVRQLSSRAETRLPRVGTELDPAWSYNGTRIAFSSDQDGDFDLYSMAPDGSQFSQITDNIAWELRPVFLRARGPIPPP
jgi:TolB protein